MRYAISLIALVAATPALAQNSSVPSDRLAEDDLRVDDAIVVTASRSGEGIPLSQLGASATVLDAEALENRQTRAVSDILRDVPGLAVNRSGGPGGLTDVRVRGSEANHVLVLIDGIEAADPFQGSFDFASLTADIGARIEVLRGQQSSLYGSDAIGGVIHYITASGAEDPGIRLRAEGGSFGTVNGAVRAAGASGALDYAVTGTYFSTDGTPTARNGTRDIGAETIAGSFKLGWTPSDTVRVTAVGRYGRTEADGNNSEFDPASPIYGYIVDSPGVYSINESMMALLRAEHTALDGRWTNALTGQVADWERTSYSPFGIDFGNVGRRYKGSFESSLRLGDDRLSHRITGAVDVEREEFRNTTPSPFAFQGERHTDNIGLVGQYELTFDDVATLGASVRRDENDRFDDVTTWRVQGSYRLPTDTRIHAAWGSGVKNPGFFELYGFSDGVYIGNPNLRPEKSEGWEVGVEQSIADGRAIIGAVYFDAELEDEIFTTFPAPDFIATPDNRDTISTQRGIEAYVSARPIPEIRLDIAYTYLKSRENGVTELRRPRHVASFNATVQSPDERLSGTLSVRYNGRQYDNAFLDPVFFSATRVQLSEYVLVNLALDYRITPSLSVFGRVENLTDEDYEEVFSYATSGTGAYGGVKLAF